MFRIAPPRMNKFKKLAGKPLDVCAEWHKKLTVRSPPTLRAFVVVTANGRALQLRAVFPMIFHAFAVFIYNRFVH